MVSVAKGNMKSTIKKLPKSQLEIEIEVSPEELDGFVNQATLNLGKDLEIEGFRKGKVPKEIIEKKVGPEKILVDAADLAIKENYKKVILENKIEAISEPEIDILKLAAGNPFVFRAKVSVLPEIKLPDYKKIATTVKKNKVFVEEKEVEDALKWLKRSRAKFILKNDVAQIGDFVEIEYWSSQIPELNQEAGKKDAFILGEARFIPGFEEELIGMKAGQEKEISLTIPPDHHLKNLAGPVRGYQDKDKAQSPQTSNGAGKKVQFRTKIISVQKVEFPEINNQFAQNLGNFKDLSALRKNIKDGINLEKEQAELQKVRNEILEKISQEMEWVIPEALIENEKNRMLEEFRQNVSNNLKISFADYLAKTKKSEKEIKESFLLEAQKRVKNFLILKKIGRIEKIAVSENEITEEVNKIIRRYPDIKKVKKELDPEKLKVYTELVLRNEKTFKLLESLTRHQYTN